MFNSNRTRYLSFAICLLVVLVSVHVYGVTVSNRLSDSVDKTLAEIMDQQKFTLEEYVMDKMELLDGIADGVVSLDISDSFINKPDEVSDFMQSVAGHAGFENLMVVQPDGTGVQLDGSSVDISEMEFFGSALNSGIFISPLNNTMGFMENAVYFSMPITNYNEELLGVVAAEISSETLEELLVPTYSGEGITVLMDPLGSVIATTENHDGVETGENIFELMSLIDFKEDVSVDELITILESETRNGYMEYSIDGVAKRFKYLPIDQTGWTLLISVPEALLSQESNLIILSTVLLFLEILFILTVVWFRMLSIKRKSLKQVERVAYYDDLTGLMNEKKFKLEVAKILKKHGDEHFSILKVDISNFKVINKLYDYNTGNEVLKAVSELSEMLQSVMKEDHFVCARIGGDEFLAFGRCEKLVAIGAGRNLYEKAINDKVAKICDRKIKLRYSRYKIPVGNVDVDAIVDMVTLTHNYCKSITFDHVYDYDENLKDRLLNKTHICDKMHSALANEEFKVYLQPKNNLDDNSICGAEALVRWQKEDGTMYFPNDFIPIFEQEGFIVDLDSYMLERVCAIIKRFRDSGLGDLPISINFSRLHMLNVDFVKQLTEVVDSYDIPRELIEIEMTETSMIENENDFKAVFFELNKRGFKLTMDDFGAGYSSLDLLSDLNFDTLKLDKSLLSKSRNSEKKKFVVKTILEMSKALSLKSVCEGVETQEQVDFLKASGCDIAQGYFYSKPILNTEFDSLLEQDRFGSFNDIPIKVAN